jgi:hypothetical protein
MLQICKHLLGGGHTVHVVTAVPEWVFVLDLTPEERALFHHRKVRERQRARCGLWAFDTVIALEIPGRRVSYR